MTPRQIPKEWLAIATLLVAGAVAWTTIKKDVQESVRTPRFEAESLRVRYRLDSDARRLEVLERAQRQYLESICRAVRCAPPPER